MLLYYGKKSGVFWALPENNVFSEILEVEQEDNWWGYDRANEQIVWCRGILSPERPFSLRYRFGSKSSIMASNG